MSVTNDADYNPLQSKIHKKSATTVHILGSISKKNLSPECDEYLITRYLNDQKNTLNISHN